jgi:CheY-like chemotaxis protein
MRASGTMSSVPPPSTNVLVVEDEIVLRMRAVDIVEDAGFTAVEAVNADEALAILESRADISLLFSDIQMPGSMDGLKLAHAVRDRWPSIKIILVSGQVKLCDSDKPANSRFFGKPLDVKQMITELQEMVGAGTLKIVPEDTIALAAESLARPKPAGMLLHSTAQEFLSAENDSLRLLLNRLSSTPRPCSRRPASRQRHCIPEPAHGDQHRARAASHRRPVDRARACA